MSVGSRGTARSLMSRPLIGVRLVACGGRMHLFTAWASIQFQPQEGTIYYFMGDARDSLFPRFLDYGEEGDAFFVLPAEGLPPAVTTISIRNGTIWGKILDGPAITTTSDPRIRDHADDVEQAFLNNTLPS